MALSFYSSGKFPGIGNQQSPDHFNSFFGQGGKRKFFAFYPADFRGNVTVGQSECFLLMCPEDYKAFIDEFLKGVNE